MTEDRPESGLTAESPAALLASQMRGGGATCDSPDQQLAQAFSDPLRLRQALHGTAFRNGPPESPRGTSSAWLAALPKCSDEIGRKAPPRKPPRSLFPLFPGAVTSHDTLRPDEVTPFVADASDRHAALDVSLTGHRRKSWWLALGFAVVSIGFYYWLFL